MAKCNKKLIYISHGNIPSKWTHTFQIMKQSEAMSDEFDDFTLLTSRGLRSSLIDSINLDQWYGIERPFQIVRLPLFWKVTEPYFTKRYFAGSNLRKFDRVASWYSFFNRPDLIYSRSPGAARYCIKLGIKTILETHAPGLEDIGLILKHANDLCFLGIVTVTEELRQQYINLGIPKPKILVMPDAVDLRRFTATPGKCDSRQLLGLPKETPIVVYCGHFYPEKGVNVLVQAAKFCPEVLFFFIGGWPEDIEKMKRLSVDQSNVKFVGFEPNDRVPAWLNSADILVLPNSGKYEHAKVTSPMKLFEYMAARRPIIASNIPALKGVVSHRGNVFLVEPDTPGQLANAILTLLRDSELSSRIANQALSDVKCRTWTNRAIAINRFFGL